jgi:PAS domain S-box-containing protein
MKMSDEIIEGIGDAIMGIASDWTIICFNRKAEEFFGRSRAEVIGRNAWECFPAGVGGELEVTFRAVMTSRIARHLDMVSPTTGRWVDLRAFPLEGGGIIVDWRDITDRKAQEIALHEAVENQDILFRELAHRVTNNFQEAAARLTYEGREIRDPVARDMVEKMAASIRCMALVNRRLYRSGGQIGELDLGNYLTALCEDLASSLPPNLALAAAVDEGTTVSTDVATTVGMMVSELVMNSRKYAWEPGEAGRMIVRLGHDGDLIEVQLWENGRGLPKGKDLIKSAGMGLKLLQLQIRRLKGTFSHENVEGGATFTLRFPASAAT